MPEVFYIARYVPRYRARFLELARERLGAEGVALRVVHGQPDAAETAKGDAVRLPWAEYRPSLIVPVGGRNVYWQPIVRRVWGADLAIVEEGSRLLVNYVLVPAQACGGPRIAYWGHGPHFAPNEVTGVGEAAKRALSTRAQWWFAYTARSAEAVTGMGYPRERVTVIENAVDTRSLRRGREEVGEAELVSLRAQLGLALDARVGVYCGALYPAKRLGFLVAAADRVRELEPRFELLVVGGGEDAPLVAAAAARRSWLHAVGPRFGAEQIRHLALAEVFLLPGFAGLAVLDAFALELPPVASLSATHGHEISYVESGSNGLLVDDGGDPRRYGEAIAGLLGDRRRLETLRAGCAEAAARYTVENMAGRFAAGVGAALAAPRRARRV